MRTSILRPGLLVIVNSHVEAGITYDRRDVATDAPTATLDGTAVVTTWTTTKVVPDPEEKKRADDARLKACKEIYDLCAKSRYAYICPVERESELNAAEQRARQIVDAHNATARTTRIDFYTIAGLMADKSEDTIRKISQEMTDLLGDMSRGIDRADPDLIRESVKRAKEMGSMLGDEQIKAVSEAVEQARKAANTIAARVTRKGEEIATVLADVQRGAIERARFAFLDMDAPAENAPEAPVSDPSPAVNVQRFADLDTCAPVTPAESAV